MRAGIRFSAKRNPWGEVGVPGRDPRIVGPCFGISPTVPVEGNHPLVLVGRGGQSGIASGPDRPKGSANAPCTSPPRPSCPSRPPKMTRCRMVCDAWAGARKGSSLLLSLSFPVNGWMSNAVRRLGGSAPWIILPSLSSQQMARGSARWMIQDGNSLTVRGNPSAHRAHLHQETQPI